MLKPKCIINGSAITVIFNNSSDIYEYSIVKWMYNDVVMEEVKVPSNRMYCTIQSEVAFSPFIQQYDKNDILISEFNVTPEYFTYNIDEKESI